MFPRRAPSLLLLMLVSCAAGCGSLPISNPTPLPHAHAHNDYAHGRPLFDALDAGFCSIEADICLVDDELRVAHAPEKTMPGRTLEVLYLDPLRKRIATNGGRIYRDGDGITLLIDFKTDWRQMYPQLRSVLRRYRDIVTTWEDDREIHREVTIVLTGGHPPPAVLLAEKTRFAAVDGGIDDIDSDVPPSVMPAIAIQWQSQFQWRGLGPFPETERARLRQLIQRVHARERTIRLWAAPDQPRAWEELFDAGVDYINTDDLTGLRAFLLKRATTAPYTRTAPAGSAPDRESR